MSSTRPVSLKHPDQIFTISTSLSLPLTRSALHPACSNQTSLGLEPLLLRWKECQPDDRSLSRVLRNLQQTLRSVHKRKILWPVNEAHLSSLEPKEYLKALLQPVASIFNQLHGDGVPMLYHEARLFNFSLAVLCGATFAANDFHRWSLTPPIVLTLPDAIFDSQGNPSPLVLSALSRAIKCTPLVPSLIVSDFKNIAVFRPANYPCPEPVFEKVSTSQSVLALRVLATAYLNDALLSDVFIKVPSPDFEVDEDLILPAGPPINPEQPLEPDEELFKTHQRHSDFDAATLVVAKPEDVIKALTGDVVPMLADPKPVYPFDWSELPMETVEHVKQMQRESPLASGGLDDALKKSKTFQLKVDGVIAEGSERGICTLYKCRITAIDGKPVSSSTSLCLKLFDDRFQKIQPPTEEEEESNDEDEVIPLARYFDPVVVADTYALNEAFAYDKLQPVQGSVVPWFYGAHKFTIPNGMYLYGLLMEYIEGSALDSDFVQGLDEGRQIDVIKCCRHAARILDVADINQRDWHNGQILVSSHTTSHLDDAVLIDFASTT
ncbi:hypothetical protein BDY19DRAFT_991317 [Irpex rosettiformis]|uniref:Uncharacterized protein n=1 Tax=Irpex rosettiformis TaxID=378272 RepID=A0ACB8UBS4_9APHY|nr:hypothetical protein BDY19DRAFT_991317 [Irpex rosettiformis]